MFRVLESLPRRRRRLVFTAVAVLLSAATPPLWSLTDSWARSTFPRWAMHQYRQQSLSEADQARFRARNERLLIDQVGFVDPLVVTEISHRSHTPESSDAVYAVRTTVRFVAPGPQEKMSTWYDANGVGVAPADVIHTTVTDPVWAALDEMIAEFEAAGFDRTHDEVRGEGGMFYDRSVMLDDGRARVSVGFDAISVKRFA